MSIVNFCFINRTLNYHPPKLLIVVAQMMELFGETEKYSLVVYNFVFPLINQNLFKLCIK